MKIVLSRIDERLIHGQVMTSWVKRFYITKIILVDDNIAKDDFTREVLTLAAPNGVNVLVLSVEETLNLIKADTDDEKTMLLFKSMSYVLELIKRGYKMDRLNIGNIGSAPSRNSVTNQVYMSQAERDMAKELCSKGVYVYIQKMPTDSELDILKKI